MKLIDYFINQCNSDIEVLTSLQSAFQSNLDYTDKKLNALLYLKSQLDEQKAELESEAK